MSSSSAQISKLLNDFIQTTSNAILIQQYENLNAQQIRVLERIAKDSSHVHGNLDEFVAIATNNNIPTSFRKMNNNERLLFAALTCGCSYLNRLSEFSSAMVGEKNMDVQEHDPEATGELVLSTASKGKDIKTNSSSKKGTKERTFTIFFNDKPKELNFDGLVRLLESKAKEIKKLQEQLTRCHQDRDHYRSLSNVGSNIVPMETNEEIMVSSKKHEAILKQQTSEYEKHLAQATKSASDMKAQYEQVLTAKNVLYEENKRLMDDKKILTQQINDISKARSGSDEMDTMIQNMTHGLQKLTKDREELISEISQGSIQLSALQKKLELTELELSNSQLKLSHKETAEIEGRESLLASYNTLKEVLTTEQDKNKELALELNKTKVKYAALQEQYDNLTDTNAKSDTNNFTLQQQILQLNIDIEHKESELKSKNKIIENMKTQQVAATVSAANAIRYNQIEQELQDAQNDLAGKIQELNELNKKYLLLDGARKTAESSQSTLLSKLKTTEGELSDALEMINQLNASAKENGDKVKTNESEYRKLVKSLRDEILKLTDVENKLKTANDELEHKNEEIQTLNNAAQNNTSEFKRLQNKLNDSEEKVRELNRQSQESQNLAADTVKELQNTIANQNTTLEDNNREISKLKGEITKLKGEIIKLKEEITKLKEETANLNSDLQGLRDNEITRLTTELERVNKERDSIKRQLTTKESELRTLTTSKRADNEELRKKLNEVESLSETLSKKDEDITSKTNEIRELNRQLKKLKDDQIESNKTIGELQQQINNLSHEKEMEGVVAETEAKLTAEFQKLKSEYSLLEKTKRDLEKTITERESTIQLKAQEITNAATRLQTEKDNRDREVSKLKTERTNLNETIRTLNEELDQLKHEKTRIEITHSAEINKKDDDVKDWKNKQKVSEAETLQMKLDKERAEQKEKDTNEELESKKRDITKLASEITRLKSELQTEQSKIQNLQTDITNLQSELQKGKGALTEAEKTVTTLQQKEKLLGDEVAQKEEELKKSKKETEDVTQNFDAFKTKYNTDIQKTKDDYDEKITRLSTEHKDQLKKNTDEYNTELQRLKLAHQNIIHQKDSTIDDKEKEVKKLQEDIEKLKVDHVWDKSENEKRLVVKYDIAKQQLEDEIKRIQKEYDEVIQENSLDSEKNKNTKTAKEQQLLRKIKTLTREKETQKREYDDLKKEYDDLKKELEAEQSVSNDAIKLKVIEVEKLQSLLDTANAQIKTLNDQVDAFTFETAKLKNLLDQQGLELGKVQNEARTVYMNANLEQQAEIDEWKNKYEQLVQAQIAANETNTQLINLLNYMCTKLLDVKNVSSDTMLSVKQSVDTLSSKLVVLTDLCGILHISETSSTQQIITAARNLSFEGMYSLTGGNQQEIDELSQRAMIKLKSHNPAILSLLNTALIAYEQFQKNDTDIRTLLGLGSTENIVDKISDLTSDLSQLIQANNRLFQYKNYTVNAMVKNFTSALQEYMKGYVLTLLHLRDMSWDEFVDDVKQFDRNATPGSTLYLRLRHSIVRALSPHASSLSTLFNQSGPVTVSGEELDALRRIIRETNNTALRDVIDAPVTIRASSQIQGVHKILTELKRDQFRTHRNSENYQDIFPSEDYISYGSTDAASPNISFDNSNLSDKQVIATIAPYEQIVAEEVEDEEEVPKLLKSSIVLTKQDEKSSLKDVTRTLFSSKAKERRIATVMAEQRTKRIDQMVSKRNIPEKLPKKKVEKMDDAIATAITQSPELVL